MRLAFEPSECCLRRSRKGEAVPVLLVLFDMKGKKEYARNLAEAIEEHPAFLQLSPETYLIETDRDSDDVFDSLKRKIGIDDNDSLVVLTVPQPYVGRAPARVKQWLARQTEKYLDAVQGDSGVFLPE